MSIFDLDTEGNAAVAEDARANPISIDEVRPGFFRGLPKAIGMGVMRGGAKTFDAFDTLTDAVENRPVMSARGTNRLVPPVAQGVSIRTPEEEDRVQRERDEFRKSAIDYWTPNANEVGTAGRVLGNFSEIALPLMLAGGNPSVLMGETAVESGKDLIDQGVDAQTAANIGALEAAATGVGFKLPFLGSTLTSRVASGAIGNLALGAGTTGAERLLLDAAGYEKVAEQFNPFDLEARTVDILSGLAFGGLAHVTSIRDAAHTTLNAKHFQQDTAPGIPADSRSSVLHQSAIERALNDLEDGNPVHVDESVTDAEFLRKPTRKSEAVNETIRENIEVPEPQAEPGLVIPRAEHLSAADREIETRMAERIAKDPDAAIRAYEKLPDSEAGKILNTDIARELSPEYLADRSKSAAVHEPASAIVKEMYARKLKEAPKPGEEPLVVFTAGGTGAGKTTGLEISGLGEKAQIIYDSNMNSLESSVRKIEQALEAGKGVQIQYTYRNPVEALTGGALPRAMRQEKEFGTGRTVPVREHARTHEGSEQVVRQLAARYKDNPRVNITVVDNSRGRGKAQVSDLSAIPKGEYNGLEGQLREALDTEKAKGSISDSVYHGFRGEEVQPQGIRPEAGGSRSQEAEQVVTATPIETQAAAAAISINDFDIPTGELNADGTPKTVSARELMAEARAGIALAKRESKAFDAAVTCFLSAA